MRSAPSLLLRAALSVVAAFVVVFAVLLAGIGYTSLRRETGELDRELVEGARRFAVALDEVGAPNEVAALLRLQRRLMVEERGNSPPVHLFVARRDGRLRDATAGAPALDIDRLEDGVNSVTIAGTVLRAYVGTGAQWRAAVVDDPALRARQVLAETAADLFKYLLWAMPIMVLPVWFAVRSALAPLKRLAADVAQRRPDDTARLVLSRAYAELQPLVDALNGQFRRAAARLERERSFVHDAAHELRTPLAVIDAQAHLLASSEGPGRAQARQQLEAAVARASHLTQQLLRLAQADALEAAPRAPVDVMALARDTLAACSTGAPQQGAELSLSGPDALVVETDARALRSVLENLVDNALRYGGAGVTVDVVVADDGDAWTLTVADDGPGIPAEDRERAFERFWRGRAPVATGAGLGLAIVREAVRSLGGEVLIGAGPLGSGCRVVARLPRQGAAAA